MAKNTKHGLILASDRLKPVAIAELLPASTPKRPALASTSGWHSLNPSCIEPKPFCTEVKPSCTEHNSSCTEREYLCTEQTCRCTKNASFCTKLTSSYIANTCCCTVRSSSYFSRACAYLLKAYFWFFQAYFWRFQAYSCLCKTCSCLFQTGSAARKNPLSFPRLASPLALLLTPLARAAGPYPGGPGSPDTDAIPAASVLYRGWATGVSAFAPGPRQAGTNATPVNYGSAPSVLGPPDAAGATYPVVGPNPIPAAPVLSLGDGGSVTLTFSPPIADGEGPDFAVFENGFATTATGLFAELAFVEVSSNGQDFTRFPAISCTQTLTQLANGGTLDPRDLHNLAGKHPAGYGTPFDLSELTASPALDTSRITHIRITDVTGDVKNGRGSRDSLGQLINDPWPTNFQTSGFDLDAIGVMHQTPAVPALTLTVAAHSVALQYLRDPLDITSTLTLQHSLNGTDWQPLAESIHGQDTQPLRNDVTITEGLPGPPVPVIVTAARTAPREFYRLRLATTP